MNEQNQPDPSIRNQLAPNSTPHHRSQEALRQSEEKYRRLFETMATGFAVGEAMRDETGKMVNYRLTQVNPAFERLTGLQANQAVGKPILAVLPGLDAWWLDTYQQVVDSGETVHVEAFLPPLNRWYEVTAFYYGEEQFAAYYNDITERKRQQANLAFLAQVSQELVRLSTIDEMMTALSAKIGGHFKASRCAFFKFNQTMDEAVCEYDWHRTDMSNSLRSYRTADFYTDEFGQTMRAGEAFVVRDRDTDSRVDATSLAALRIASLIATPILTDQPSLFVLSINDTVPRNWHEDEIELMRELTSRIWARLERAHAEEALRQSEARLQLALDAAQMGTFVWYPSGDQGNTDARTLALYGLDSTDELNHARGLNELIVTADRAGHADKVARALDPAGDGLLRSEYRIHRASDGAQRWIATLAQTQFAGEPPVAISITGVCADVTASKQAAAALLEQEQRQAFLLKLSDALRPLSDSAQLEHTAMQVLGQELGVNRAFFATIDADGESWSIQHDYTEGVASNVGRYPMSSFQRSRLPQWQAGRLSSITDSETDAGLSEADRAAYAVLGTRAAIGVPLVKGGRFAALLSVNQTGARAWTEAELTLTCEAAERTWVAIEAAKVEEALRASQKRFESIANLVPDLLWDSAPDGATNWYNQRWLEYTGQRFEEAIDWGWTEAIHPDDQEASAKRYGEAVKAGTSLRQEHRIRRHDGEYRWFVVSSSPLKDQTGQVVNRYGAATDIHDHKRLEATLLEADRRKDEFLAMLAHELRNPMATLQNTLLLLELTHGQSDTLPLERALTMMSREVTHLNRMVDDLLDVSRISQGKIHLKKDRLDWAGLIREALEATHAQLSSQGHKLIRQLPNEPIWVDGDRTRLTQVVHNLVTNAAKYTPHGGQIRVELEKEHSQAVLRVRDTGIGLAVDQLEAIFEVFVQVSSSLDRPQGGLGLGLAVVKQLVQLHDGQVGVQSAGLGQGSEFTVSLPLQSDVPASTAFTDGGQGVAKQAGRILVVDDNADLALTTALLLGVKNYEAHTCLGGSEALKLVVSLQPDVVLLDLGMPGMDGYETCRRLRALDWGQQGVIVALSGYGQEEDKQRTLAGGFDGHLVKPVHLQTLTALLDKLLKGQASGK